MRIVDVRSATSAVSSNIRNAYVDFSRMTASVVAIVTDVVRDGRPVVGYGFNSNGRYAVTGLLRERFIPRLLEAPADTLLNEAASNFEPARVWSVLMANEKPGGHGERSVAVGTLDMAVWDAIAKIEEKPLWRLVADRFRVGEVDEQVAVYAAGGYYQSGKDDRKLQDEIRGYLDSGYTQVKIKIGGALLAEDIRRIEAAMAVLPGGQALAVDANGRFDLKTALAYGEALQPYELRWFEEAGDPLDYQLQATLGENYAGPMATGENLFSVQDALNLIRHAGMRPDRDILQFDPVLTYGLVEYLRILDMLKLHGWSWRRCVPHGGHQFALNIAAGLGLGGNESYPGVFQPFGGFADDTPVNGGFVRLHDSPGIGIECKRNLLPLFESLLR